MSVFFRRQSQTSGSTFDLALWTAPLYTKLLDEDITSTTAPERLLALTLAPAAGLSMSVGTGAKVFGAQIADAQAVGTLLFWEMKNTVQAGSIVGDLYVVPNHTGTLANPSIGRSLDVVSSGARGQRVTQSRIG